jgi:hypothetical protein
MRDGAVLALMDLFDRLGIMWHHNFAVGCSHSTNSGHIAVDRTSCTGFADYTNRISKSGRSFECWRVKEGRRSLHRCQ